MKEIFLDVVIDATVGPIKKQPRGCFSLLRKTPHITLRGL